MAVGVAVLRTEHRRNLKHAFHVTSNAHLLVQLWTLSQVSAALEIFDLEDVATTLGGSTHQLRGEDPP